MATLQEYLNQKYPTRRDKEKVKEIKLENPLPEEVYGGELDLTEYPNLKKVFIYGVLALKSGLTKLELGKQEKLSELTCSHNQLTYLAITGCPNLKKLNCSFNLLTSLVLSNVSNLDSLDCQNNLLTDLNFLNGLNPRKMDYLLVYDNNFVEQDLSIFSPLVKLTNLGIGNYFGVKERIEQGTYNRFIGSLKPLRNMTKLNFLEMSNTDISKSILSKIPDNADITKSNLSKIPDIGIEYLPNSLKTFDLR